MAIPPSIKKTLPSLQIKTDETAVLDLADLKTLLPSLEISVGGRDLSIEGLIKLSLPDLRKVLAVALSGIEVDETWYLSIVPELEKDIPKGKFSSVADHYYKHGYLEGRLPEKPTVDEKFYLQAYPDVAVAIKAGRVRNAYEHFVRDGYAEGRQSSPPDSASQRKGKNK